MLATLTSKGQITLPKAVRDALNLQEGSRLDFQVVDGLLQARPVRSGLEGVIGVLNQPGRTVLSAAEMRKAAIAAVAVKHRSAVAQSEVDA